MTSQAQHQTVRIVPLTGRIGAEILGVELSGDLDAPTVALIRAALLKHKVIFFPKQVQLSDAGQEAFAALLGTPVAHPTVPTVKNTATMLELDSKLGSRSNGWHTDITFVDAYPAGSILRMVVKPEVGGDTVWANTATAYEDLPAEFKAFVDQAWATHSNDFDYASLGASDNPLGVQAYEAFVSTIYETQHPLVRVHPETGERSLVLGQFLQRINGFSLARTAVLYQLLQSYVTRLENIVRWRWSVGDVAIWDNRATQHYAVDDYGDQHRVIRRVTIAGDAPVSIDGRQSFTVKPEPQIAPQSRAVA